jgi:hypothetical protein
MRFPAQTPIMPLKGACPLDLPRARFQWRTPSQTPAHPVE